MCPTCRKPIQSAEAGNLPTNFSLLVTSQVSIKSPSEDKKSDSSPDEFTCSSHPSKKVKFHCSGCQQSFCSNCVIKHTGEGHKIEDVTQAIDHKLDQLLLEVGSTDAGLVQLTGDFEEFGRGVGEMEALRGKVEALYDAGIDRLRKEREEMVAAINQGIEVNKRAVETAREEIRAKTASFSEVKELLRTARHSLTNPSEKQTNYQKAERLIGALWGKKPDERSFGLRRPECELKKYTFVRDNFPAKFIEIQPSLISFVTPLVEEKKEAPPVEGKKAEVIEEKKEAKRVEGGTQPPVQKGNVSLQREPVKGKKRGDICWWYVNDGNNWAPYTPYMNRTIETAFQNHEPTVDLGRYLVDFATLTQVNKKTNRSRKIGREIS